MSSTAIRRRTTSSSTLGVDMSVRYPYSFTGMSLSPYSRDVVLAGSSGLVVIDLEFPLSQPRTIPIDSPWKVADVAWCPSKQQHSWVGTTVNQTLLIYDLAHNTNKPMRVLKSHPMAITDIAWAPKIPSWVGTTSIDPIIKIWDVRQDQKPVWYYSEWDPADFLAFNNVEIYKLASVHRNKIAIWDLRYGSGPVRLLDEAHNDKINSICWHPKSDNIILSASRDGTVKKWRVDIDDTEELYELTFPYEILGAKYTPFGDGILVKQQAPDNSILLVKDDPQLTLTHRFVGHTEPVLEMLWRSRGSIDVDTGADMREFQLVSWGRDQTLRMWSINDSIIESVGGNPAQEARHGTAYEEQTPSFTTNFQGPDDILYLVKQKLLPSDLLLAAARKSDMPDVTTLHEYNRLEVSLRQAHMPSHSNSDSKSRRFLTSGSNEAKDQRLPTRLSGTDERSSDDESDTGYASGIAMMTWKEEVQSTAVDKYGPSGTVKVNAIIDGARRCIMTIGAPWITRDTLRVRVDFPPEYPISPLSFEIEKAGLTYRNKDMIQTKLSRIAKLCSHERSPALDHCLYSLAASHITAARKKGSHRKLSSLQSEDLEHLPPPPSPLGQYSLENSSGISKMQPSPFRLNPYPHMGLRSRSKDRADSSNHASRNERSRRSASPNRFSDDENEHSGLSNYDRDDDSVDGNNNYLYSDNELDEFGVPGYDEGDGMYYSDSSQAGFPIGMDGSAIPIRHTGSTEQQDRMIPFPRLCGGVFSGPGVLICFFSSIYTPETYPEPSGIGQHDSASREKHREDMIQHLRLITKPRLFVELRHYCGMVRFGLQHNDGFLSQYGDQKHPEFRTGSSGRLGTKMYSGFDDSDIDEEVRGEEVPLYYFQQQINRNTRSITESIASENRVFFKPVSTGLSRNETGVGNIVMICKVPQDKSGDLNLAKQFVLSGPSAEWICQHNATISALNNRPELAHIWSLLKCLLSPAFNNSSSYKKGDVTHGTYKTAGSNLPTWSTHPLILLWLRTIMSHYERRGDVQALALVSCIISKAVIEFESKSAQHSSQPPSESEKPLDGSPPWMKEYQKAKNSGADPDTNAEAKLSIKSQAPFGADGQQVGAPQIRAASEKKNKEGGYIKESKSNKTSPPANAHMHVDESIIPLSLSPSLNYIRDGVSAHATRPQRRFSIDKIKAVTEDRISVAGVLQRLLMSATSINNVSHLSLIDISRQAGLPTTQLGSMLGQYKKNTYEDDMQNGSSWSTPSRSRRESHNISYNDGDDDSDDDDDDDDDGDGDGEYKQLMSDMDMLGSSHATQNSGTHSARTNSRSSHTTNRTNSAISNAASVNSNGGPSQRVGSRQGNTAENSEVPDNLWNRLRSNVLGRVHTAQIGDIGHKDGESSGPRLSDKAGVEARKGKRGVKISDSKQRISAVDERGDRSWYKNREVSVSASVHNRGILELRHQYAEAQGSDAYTREGLVRPWDMSHIWMPLALQQQQRQRQKHQQQKGQKKGMQQSRERAATKDRYVQEFLYLQTKREFEQPHTMLVVADEKEAIDETAAIRKIALPKTWNEEGMRSLAYFDHWKILYSSMLFRWGMDTKAIEVLKCLRDPVLVDVFNATYNQPSDPHRGNLHQGKSPMVAFRPGAGNDMDIQAEHSESPDSQQQQKESRKGNANTNSRRNSTMETMSLDRTCKAERQAQPSPLQPSLDPGGDEGALWLSCSWCQEYVHGRALICHSCGHGGHQEHMLRWFRRVKRNISRLGMSSTQILMRMSKSGASSSNGGSKLSSKVASSVQLAHMMMAEAGGADSDGMAGEMEFSPLAEARPSSARQQDEEAVSGERPQMQGRSQPPLLSVSLGSVKPVEEAPPLRAASPVAKEQDVRGQGRGDGAGGKRGGMGPGDSLSDMSAEDSDHLVIDECSSDGDEGWSSGTDDDHLDYGDETGVLRRLCVGGGGHAGEFAYPRTPDKAFGAMASSSDAEGLNGDELESIPTCPAGCGCNCLLESKLVIIG